ncbi:unnamed protein product, partial [Phaeothamnion confervicola]
SCKFATNGGFFLMDGPEATTGSYCVGNVISDERIVQLDAGDAASARLPTTTPTAAIGVIRGGGLLTGFVTVATVRNFGFVQLLSGRGWIVRRGRAYAGESRDLDPGAEFFLEEAPRTALGVFPNGSIILF